MKFDLSPKNTHVRRWVERNVDELEGPPTRSEQLLYDSIIPRRVTWEAIGNDDQKDIARKDNTYRIHCV